MDVGTRLMINRIHESRRFPKDIFCRDFPKIFVLRFGDLSENKPSKF